MYIRLFLGILTSALIVDNAPFVTNIAKQFLTAETRAYVYIIALGLIAALCAWAYRFQSYVRMGFVTKVLASLAGTITLTGLVITLGHTVLPYASTFTIPSSIAILITNVYALPAWILAGMLVYVIAFRD
jgi:hypothetical protein